jgi:uncharacterized protein
LGEKLDKLKSKLMEYNRVAVAFSGGCDSTFLLKVCKEVLNTEVVALIARGPIHKAKEIEEAIEFCVEEGIAYSVLDINSLDVPGFKENSPNRCYICKRAIFSRLKDEAVAKRCDALVDGTNQDDVGDYRPGMRALRELGIVSPLKDAGLTKKEIRAFSCEYGLKTADKPSDACLASRFPYGEEITLDSLKKVAQAEKFLSSIFKNQLRVRVHGDIARIEVPEEELNKAITHRIEISNELIKIGFNYITLDLKGFRSGSMNEVLGDGEERLN